MKLVIKDFDIFQKTIEAVCKFSPSAKISASPNGIEIYVKNDIARCCIVSNSVESDSDGSFCLKDVSAFNKILKVIITYNKKHKSDDISIEYDGSFININSKSVKNKLITVKEQTIAKYISKAVTTELVSEMEFITSSENIKGIISNTFLFNDLDSIKVYIKQDASMSPNVVYAHMANKSAPLSNEITLELGNITFGKLLKEVTINFDILKMFNVFNSEAITIKKLTIPALSCELLLANNSDVFSKFNILTSTFV